MSSKPIVEDQLHYSDQRTETQKLLSNKLVQSLTQLNILRLRNNQNNLKGSGYQYIKDNPEHYLFVCFHGIPSFQNQFDFLQLPTKILHIYASGFKPNMTELQRKKQLKFSNINDQIKRVHQTLNDQQNKGKKLIVIFHSMGTFLLTNYLQTYGSQRLIGLIDIGGATITAYPYFIHFLGFSSGFTLQFLEENGDILYQGYLQSKKRQKEAYEQKIKKGLLGEKQYSMVNTLESKYQFLCFMGMWTSRQVTKSFFINNRKFPQILKIIIYGRFDTVFQIELLNQKAIYYSYATKLPKDYEEFMRSKFNLKYKKGQIQIKDVQPRFMYSIIGGKHSVHFQSKNKQLIKSAINEYIEMIGLWQARK